MTKFLSKVFLSGILLSSVSGYCTIVDNPDNLNILVDNDGSATLAVETGEKNINFNINIGDINNDGNITSDEPASLTLSNGTELKLANETANTKQTIAVYNLGKIKGPTDEGQNSTIDLKSANHSIVFHPGSETSGKLTITSSDGTHEGIVDLSNYIKGSGSTLSFSDSSYTDEKKLTLTLENVKVKLFDSGKDYTTLFSGLNNSIVFNNINANTTVTLIDVPGGVKFISDDSGTDPTDYDGTIASGTGYNSGIIKNMMPKNINKLFNGTVTQSSTGAVQNISNIISLTIGDAVIDFDSFAIDGNVTIDETPKDIFGAVLSLNQNAGVTTSLFTEEYTINDSDLKDFNRIKINNITENNTVTDSISVSNVTTYKGNTTKYTPAADNAINRTFTSSNIELVGSTGANDPITTITLTLNKEVGGSQATTLNLTGKHKVTTSLSINDGSTINLKPGSTLTLGQV